MNPFVSVSSTTRLRSELRESARLPEMFPLCLEFSRCLLTGGSTGVVISLLAYLLVL